MTDKLPSETQTPRPPKQARGWAILFSGLVVGSVVWLAPVLGTVAVPGYFPLTEAIPADVRGFLLPLISALIGLMAILVEFFLADRYSARRLRRAIWLPIVIAIISFGLLTRDLFLGVIRLSHDGGSVTEAVIVGPGERPQRCEKLCPITISDGQCLMNLTTDPRNIGACWGDSRIREAQLDVVLWYFVFMASLGGLVAIVRARKQATS